MYTSAAPLLALLSFVSLVYASSITRAEGLSPWEVTSVSSSSPATVPDSGSPAYNVINVTITDPNTIPINGTTSSFYLPSTAICTVSWASTSDPPYGTSNSCLSPIEYGVWRYAFLQIASAGTPATKDFGMKFTRVAQESEYTEIFDGYAAFAVDSNLQGTCGEAGNCLWQLKGGNAIEVLQTARTQWSPGYGQ